MYTTVTDNSNGWVSASVTSGLKFICLQPVIIFSRARVTCLPLKLFCMYWCPAWGKGDTSDSFCFILSNSVRPALADSWYSLSYLYLAPFGALITIVVGLLVSMITGKKTYTTFTTVQLHTVNLWLYENTNMSAGGCKQEKLNPDLFVKKTDFCCYHWFSKAKVKQKYT